MSLKKFLTKHAGELATIVSVAENILGVLPLRRQDRENLKEPLEKLDKASKSIAKSAAKMTDLTAALDEKAIAAVVKKVLPDILGGLIEAQVRAELKSREKESK